MTRKHKLWALMPSLPKELMIATVRQYEDAGLEGVWSPQLYGVHRRGQRRARPVQAPPSQLQARE